MSVRVKPVASSQPRKRAINNTPAGASAKKTVKPFLYSQLGTSARPLDRIRRPAPVVEEDSDLIRLIADLDTLPVDDFAEDVAAAPPIEPAKKHFVKTKVTLRRALRAVRYNRHQARTFLLLGLVAVSVLAGLLIADHIALNRSNQQARQADVQWQQDQSQWQCELQKYRAQQSEITTNQFKETTCQE